MSRVCIFLNSQAFWIVLRRTEPTALHARAMIGQ